MQRRAGWVPVASWTYLSRRRKASRYEATVCGLARRCAMSRSVKKASRVGAKRGHDRAPSVVSRRAAAAARSSGDAERYQYVEAGLTCPMNVESKGNCAMTSAPSRYQPSKVCHSEGVAEVAQPRTARRTRPGRPALWSAC